jgi:hypothetical protein
MLVMLRQFPEIQHFFKKNNFSQSDLSNLYILIDNKYKDRKVVKGAITLIELQLLKYKLKSTNQKVTNRRTRITGTSKNKNSSVKSSNQISTSFENAIHEMQKNHLNSNIEEISKLLGIDYNKFSTYLLSKNISKNKEDILSENEFKRINEFIVSQLKTIERKRIDKLKISRPSCSKMKKTKSAGVFDHIHKNGGIGKLIYTRM